MAEEQEQEEQENKRIRPREQARGLSWSKIHSMYLDITHSM